MENNQEETSNRPKAIFVCGPTAAGKSSTVKYFVEKGYDQGVILNYDNAFKSEHDRISRENIEHRNNLTPVEVANLADKNAYAIREEMFANCVKDKIPFSYENCMPDHAIDKMEMAKRAGFDVHVYITFQKSVDNHIESEKNRRHKGVEVGAFFHDDKSAEKVVRSTYNKCLSGIERAVKHSTTTKVFINYMKGDPEQNRPVMVASFDERKSKEFVITPGVKVDNKDLANAFNAIKIREKIRSAEVKQDQKNILAR